MGGVQGISDNFRHSLHVHRRSNLEHPVGNDIDFPKLHSPWGISMY